MRAAIIGSGPLADKLACVVATWQWSRVVLSKDASIGDDCEALQGVVGDCAIVVWLVDAMPHAASYRLNARVIAGGVPCLFISQHEGELWLGPLVEPGRCGCWFCLKTRQFACAPDAVAAIAKEAAEQAPIAIEPTVIDQALALVSNVIAARADGRETEVLHGAFSIGTDGVPRFHPLIARADCPHCGRVIENDPVEAEPIGLESAAALLVDPATGIISYFNELPPVDPSEPMPPIITHCVLADHALTGSGGERCFGKGFTGQEARSSALGEAIERYAGRCWLPDALVVATTRALGDEAIDPATLILFDDEQYAELPYRRFDPEEATEWVAMTSLGTGKARMVPSWAVFTDRTRAGSSSLIAPGTTTGLAAGRTFDEAAENALLEVIERDAFAVAWLAQLPGVIHDPRRHPDSDVISLVDAFDAIGVSIELYALPVDHGVSVFAALLHDGSRRGPAVAMGLGASVHKPMAARRALLEAAQVRRVLDHRLTNPRVRARMATVAAHPELVADAEDHALFYASGAHRDRFDFLMGGQASDWVRQGEPAPGLMPLVQQLGARELDVLVRDLTPPDLRRLRVRVARVVVPGAQPMHFGNAPRLGSRRVLDAPLRLGVRGKSLTTADVSRDPHPFC